MSLFDESAPNPAGHRDVSVAQVTLPHTGYLLIDVREPDEFSGPLGHIEGATLVPMGAVMARSAEWKKDEPILLVCRSGGRSGNVAQALTRLGFTRAMNLVGGMIAWNAAGKPVEK